jgi:hypothetical protein
MTLAPSAASRRAIVLGVLATAATLVVAAVALNRPAVDGPLRGAEPFRVSIPAADGELVRWDTALPWNPTNVDIQLDSVELVGARGLELVGVVLSYPTLQPNGTCLSAGNGPGFPPAGRTEPVQGVVLPAATRRACTNYPTIVAGLRRPMGVPNGTVDAIRVVYEYEGKLYQLLMPTSFELRRP